jgi:hypothetical protein
MLNKSFEKGITILEALVATAILGMIAMFFINSSSLFLGSQQTLVQQNKYRQLADLIIKDISEYVKSEFDPYGQVETDETVKEGRKVRLRGIDEVPKVGDIFLVEGVGNQFKIVDDPFSPKKVSDKIYEISVKDEIFAQVNDFEEGKKITFISFKKNELTCFTTEINLITVVPSDLPCEQDIKDLVTGWQNKIKADTKITYATIEMSNENLFTVTLGDGINNTTIAKKFPQCAFNINVSKEAVDTGGVEFDFGGNIGVIETGIMVGDENPTHHFILNKKNHKQYLNMGADASPSDVKGNSCKKTVSYSTCRQHYSYLNAVAVFLYQYNGTGSKGNVNSDTTPEYTGDVWLQASSCKTGFSVPSGGKWNQCEKLGEQSIDHDNDPETPREKIDIEKVETNELSLWFIFSKADGLNGKGYLGFRTANLPAGARVLVFDDSNESCYERIELHNGAYKCDGGYDWGGKHDGLVLHLDKTVDDINQLKDVFLSLTSPSYNIKEWKVLKSGPIGDDDTWTDACLKAENVVDSAFEEGPKDHCWQTIESTFSTLKGDISSTADELTINEPDDGRYGESNVNHTNQFAKEDGFLRIGTELIAYDEYDPLTGKFTGLVRGLFNKVKVIDINADEKSNRIQVGCVDNMEAVGYPNEKYIKKLSLYNDRANELLDLRAIDVCAQGEGDSKKFASRSMEMGRWYSWAHNETKNETHTLEQRVSGNFVVTRDHKYQAGSNEFSVNDIIYNELSKKAAHSNGDRVYDGDPVINAPGIYLNRDGTFPDLMNSSSDYSAYSDNKQLVISVPRKVQLKTSTARLPSTIMACGK